ncbi:acetate--CoA ligase family protein [Desulfatitalea alkaliphila]|uniref:Acetate--CoA ligase family protein n=1 Tax=Desulfatitalea alkaliphila TaxID=2929485 RepID=A0AA41R5G2_9BACT|nr:acetate--CoA ligase family protein [Desulfatitalea alkaliphila]MCJ8501191.1 acetate--CoA ligase family protein [Desulfatitalea alkaliphila]
MNQAMAQQIIQEALAQGRKALSEHEAKQVLTAFDIPVTREVLVTDRTALADAAASIGFPVVMKGCAADIVHKTERHLVRLDVRDAAEALRMYDEIVGAMQGVDGGVLVQEMVRGRRELVIGLTRDPQFGPCVMFGLGGIFTEILKDIAFRRAPLSQGDAMEMMAEIKGAGILEAVRGMPAADKEALSRILMAVGNIALAFPAVAEIDLNPVILAGERPVAVDALMVVRHDGDDR